jgi:hypothetical protein
MFLLIQVHVLYKPDKSLGHDGQREKQGNLIGLAPPTTTFDDNPQSH